MSLRRSLVLAIALCAACGGGRGGGTTEAPVAPAAPQPADEEHTLAELTLEGIRFTPGALGYPQLTRVTRGKTPLATARKKAGKSAVDAQIFASLAWAEADRLAGKDEAGARALREEARAALAAAAGKGKADAVTLEMLGTASMWLDDAAAATAAFEELLKRFPKHPGTDAFRTWLASLYLRQQRVADARALVEGRDPTAGTELEAYVLGWVHFTARDYPAARRAIVSAASRWETEATRPGLERDLVLILARGGAAAPDALGAIAQVTPDEARRAALAWTLADAYANSGAFEEAIAVLDAILEMPGQDAGDKVVGARFRQADYHFRLNQPARAAERAIAAYQALPACGAACTAEVAEAVTKRLAMLAQFSHGVFVTTRDAAHADAAAQLYAAYLAIPDRPDAAALASYQKNLEDARKAPPAPTRHGDKLVADLALVRVPQLTACYEAVLVAEPSLSGAVRLAIEVSDKGEVLGVSSEPGAGQEGLGAVATCLVERVRTWSYPSRATPGVTRIALPLAMKPRADKAEAQPAAAGEAR